MIRVSKVVADHDDLLTNTIKIKDMVDLPANQYSLEYDNSLLRYIFKCKILKTQKSVCISKSHYNDS